MANKKKGKGNKKRNNAAKNKKAGEGSKPVPVPAVDNSSAPGNEVEEAPPLVEGAKPRTENTNEETPAVTKDSDDAKDAEILTDAEQSDVKAESEAESANQISTDTSPESMEKGEEISEKSLGEGEGGASIEQAVEPVEVGDKGEPLEDKKTEKESSPVDEISSITPENEENQSPQPDEEVSEEKSTPVIATEPDQKSDADVISSSLAETSAVDAVSDNVAKTTASDELNEVNLPSDVSAEVPNADALIEDSKESNEEANTVTMPTEIDKSPVNETTDTAIETTEEGEGAVDGTAEEKEPAMESASPTTNNELGNESAEKIGEVDVPQPDSKEVDADVTSGDSVVAAPSAPASEPIEELADTETLESKGIEIDNVSPSLDAAAVVIADNEDVAKSTPPEEAEEVIPPPDMTQIVEKSNSSADEIPKNEHVEPTEATELSSGNDGLVDGTAAEKESAEESVGPSAENEVTSESSEKVGEDMTEPTLSKSDDDINQPPTETAEDSQIGAIDACVKEEAEKVTAEETKAELSVGASLEASEELTEKTNTVTKPDETEHEEKSNPSTDEIPTPEQKETDAPSPSEDIVTESTETNVPAAEHKSDIEGAASDMAEVKETNVVSSDGGMDTELVEKGGCEATVPTAKEDDGNVSQHSEQILDEVGINANDAGNEDVAEPMSSGETKEETLASEVIPEVAKVDTSNEASKESIDETNVITKPDETELTDERTSSDKSTTGDVVVESPEDNVAASELKAEVKMAEGGTAEEKAAVVESANPSTDDKVTNEPVEEAEENNKPKEITSNSEASADAETKEATPEMQNTAVAEEAAKVEKSNDEVGNVGQDPQSKESKVLEPTKIDTSELKETAPEIESSESSKKKVDEKPPTKPMEEKKEVSEKKNTPSKSTPTPADPVAQAECCVIL